MMTAPETTRGSVSVPWGWTCVRDPLAAAPRRYAFRGRWAVPAARIGTERDQKGDSGAANGLSRMLAAYVDCGDNLSALRLSGREEAAAWGLEVGARDLLFDPDLGRAHRGGHVACDMVAGGCFVGSGDGLGSVSAGGTASRVAEPVCGEGAGARGAGRRRQAGLELVPGRGPFPAQPSAAGISPSTATFRAPRAVATTSSWPRKEPPAVAPYRRDPVTVGELTHPFGTNFEDCRRLGGGRPVGVFTSGWQHVRGDNFDNLQWVAPPLRCPVTGKAALPREPVDVVGRTADYPCRLRRRELLDSDAMCPARAGPGRALYNRLPDARSARRARHQSGHHEHRTAAESFHWPMNIRDGASGPVQESPA